MMHYIHSVPGRLRIKIPLLKRNAFELGKIQVALRETRGVNRIRVDQLTGSVIIHYNPGLVQLKALLEFMRKRGFIEDTRETRKSSASQEFFTTFVQEVGRSLLSSTLQGSGLSLLAILISSAAKSPASMNSVHTT
jgi:hypothetical protein